MFIRLASFIMFLLAQGAWATESDNFTDRQLILSKANAAPAVEKLVNSLILSAVAKTNEQVHSKDQVQELFTENLRKRLASDSFGVLALIVQSQSPFKVYGVPVTPLEWVVDQQNLKDFYKERSFGVLDLVAHPTIRSIQSLKWGNDFDELLKTRFPLQSVGHRVKLEESIFKKLNIFESGISGMPGIMFVASLNIDGNVIGVDKLGHFFAQGYSYYENFQKGQSLEEILKKGKFEEESSFGKGVFGISTFGSGVVSYGDLAANFHGFEFWRDLFHPEKGHLQIVDGKVEMRKAFQLSDYPLYSWDEAVNISSHHGLAAADIRSAIQSLGYDWSKPVDTEKALALHKLKCASFFTSENLKIQSNCYTSQ